MAEAREMACSNCGQRHLAWDEGDPWVRLPNGRKRYVYHPDPLTELREGVDMECLCLGCGRTSRRDPSRAPWRCHGCGSRGVSQIADLAGCECPHCRKGIFRETEAIITS